MATKSTKSTKPARMTDADRMSAMAFGAFTDTMRAAVAKGADAVREMAVAFYAATVHGEASKWSGATGKGAYAWAVAECGRSSEVERQPSRLNVVGSIPTARFPP